MQIEKTWDDLQLGEQAVYIRRAQFLISKGYVNHTDVEELAKQIFESSVSKTS